MASLVARAATALPSGPARRLGSGRLPLAARPGHGVVALAGRKGGAGHGGVLAVEFTAPARDVKAAYGKAACAPAEPDDGDDFAKVHVQDKLKDVAERCMALTSDTMRRLPRAERRRMDLVFWQAHHAFATVRSRAAEGRATLAMAVVIAGKLDVVRRMVSCACSAPLPLDTKQDKELIFPFSGTVFPVSRAEVLMLSMIDNLYETVKSDIEAMISAAPRA